MLKISNFLSKIHPQIIPIVVLSLLAHTTLSGGRVVSSLFVLQEGYSESIAGLTYGLYGLMPALLSLHMGKLVDRIGARVVMRTSLLVIMIGLLTPAIYLSVESVLICATLSGLGFGGYILSAQTSVSLFKVEKKSDRTGMFAWLQMGTSISAVTGPILVGFIVDSYNFSAVYFSLAAIVGIGVVQSFNTDIPESIYKPEEDAKGTSVIQEVIHDRSLLKIYLLSMATYFAWDCFSFLIPVLGVRYGYSATDIGLVLSLFAIGTLIVRAFMPWISGKITELRTLCLSYGLSSFVFLLLPIADGILYSCLLSFIFGILAGLWHACIQNIILIKVGKQRSGEASGLRLMTGNLSGMLGTTGSGAIIAIAGFPTVFIGIAAIMGIASLTARSD
jgi:MFS family permease